MQAIKGMMALPSVVLLHGLGFLLLLSWGAGWGRQPSLLLTVIAVASAAVLWRLVLEARNRALVMAGGDWAFAAIIAAVVLSLAWQPWGAPWVRINALYLLFLAVLPYLCGRLVKPDDLKLFTSLVVVVFAVSLTIYAVIFLTVDDSQWHYRPIIYGSDEVTARMASLCAYVCMIGWYWYMSSSYKPSIWLEAVAVGMLFALVIFLSFLGLRGVVLATVPAVLLTCAKANWLGRLHRFSIVLLYLGAVICAYYLFGSAVAKDVNAMRELAGIVSDGAPIGCGASEENVSSFSIRMELFRDAWAQFEANPIFGGGAGTFGQHSCWRSPLAHPHNVVLQALGELGIVGALILVCILAYAMARSIFQRWRRHDRYNLAFMMFVFAVFNSMVNGNYFTSAELWWSLGLMGAWAEGRKTSIEDPGIESSR